MTSQDLLLEMKDAKISLLTISEKASIKWNKLDQAVKGTVELRESDYRNLFKYARSMGFDV